MYFGKDPENMKHMIGAAIERMLYLREPKETCPYMPDTVHIEPIGICNLDCAHCVRRKITRKQGTMTLAQFKSIIDKVAPFKCNISIGRNGEPLLHKNIVEMIDYVKSKKLFASVITNATLLGPELSQSIIKAGLDRIVFSFDSVDKEVYEKIRIRAKFDGTLRNILYFLKHNYEAGMPVHTSISWTTTRMAKESPTDIKKYFMRFPIGDVYPSELLNMFGDTMVDEEFVEDVNKGVPQASWPICTNGWDRIGIQWNGSVVPCVVDFDDRYVIGNILTQSLPDIINGPEARKFRKALLERDYCGIEKNGNLCSKCSVKWLEGFDARDIVEATKNNIVREISSRETPETFDNERRYRELLKEIKKRGWL